jgi:hypothetical protein
MTAILDLRRDKEIESQLVKLAKQSTDPQLQSRLDSHWERYQRLYGESEALARSSIAAAVELERRKLRRKIRRAEARASKKDDEGRRNKPRMWRRTWRRIPSRLKGSLG